MGKVNEGDVNDGTAILRGFRAQLNDKATFDAMTAAAKWNLARRILLVLVRRALR